MPINSSQSEEKQFFKTAALQLLEVLYAIAEQTCYPDLLMVHALLCLPQLDLRLSLAEKQNRFNLWIEVSPAENLICHVTSLTSAGIVSTACHYLNLFLFVGPNYQFLIQAEPINFKLRTRLAEALLPIE